MRSFKLADVITIVDILGAVGSFLLIFVGSTMIGVFFACFSALVYKHTNMREFPHLESGMFVMFAYASYLFAQGIGASGKVLKKNSVCSVLFCFKKVCLVFSRYRINAFLWYCHGALHLRELVSQVSADHQGINHRPLEIFEIQIIFFLLLLLLFNNVVFVPNYLVHLGQLYLHLPRNHHLCTPRLCLLSLLYFRELGKQTLRISQS